MMLEPLKTKFYKPPVQRVVEKKHPLIERIMKLPEHRRMEFFRRFPNYYQAARKRGILEKATKHMPCKHKNKRIQKK